ncbi:MAG: metallopeptidase family protein [Acidobacteriia bacterium]|nr:metallopeptidase family protein [Terriglobia bacterium]
MAGATNSEGFEEIVEWAYSTQPQEIREQPDFPAFKWLTSHPRTYSKRKNSPAGREMLGCFSGVHKTQRSLNQVRIAPDLIFVFRGPILRCSKGDLRVEVKRVVWHEVAHWLGHDEEQVKDLGL